LRGSEQAVVTLCESGLEWMAAVMLCKLGFGWVVLVVLDWGDFE
jgi:hypothetical protein